MPNKVVAIDGKAGSGKTTIAKLLANKLNFKYVDSGILYRAIAYFGITRMGSDFPNRLGLAAKYFSDNPQTIQLILADNDYSVVLSGSDVTKHLRDEALNDVLNIVSGYEPFRKIVNHILIRLHHRNNLVVDGRDIGTELFPNAWKKFFFHADLETRTKRRAKQLDIQQNTKEYEYLQKNIAERDEKDENRSIAPLKAAEDAILIETSNKNAAESLEEVYSYCQ